MDGKEGKIMLKAVVFLLLIMFLVVGCQQATEVPSTREPIDTIVSPTQESTDTKAPPTHAPEPTNTEIPLTMETGTLEFDGQERNFIVFIPDNYSDTNKFPLLIYLHSYGWDAQKGMDYTQLNQVGNTYNFIIVYPNAKPNWNSGIGDSSSWPTPDNDDVGFISGLIDNLSEQYSIDLERIYAAGYSNGGFMAYRLACHLSQRIAAIASVSGVMSTSVEANCNPSRKVPVLQIHGTEDPWVPIEGSNSWLSVDQTLSYWINFNKCENSEIASLQDLVSTDECTVEKTSFTNCTDNSKVIYYKVINGGHTWPGAGPPGYSAGNTNQDFNASQAIWNFIKDYRLKIEN
jgi:polyhydroxybutyrate depolymerase